MVEATAGRPPLSFVGAGHFRQKNVNLGIQPLHAGLPITSRYLPSGTDWAASFGGSEGASRSEESNKYVPSPLNSLRYSGSFR